MNIYFEERFFKDLKKLNDKNVLRKIREIISDFKQLTTNYNILNIKKLKGYETYYRIRCGNYRIGIEIIENKVIFVRCLHRKDIYRYFPN